MILWHHFAIYPPLCTLAEPLIGPLVHWFHHYARATQVFFVVGGYVMARTMSGKEWGMRALGVFIVHRYCRLGIPYLAVIAVAIIACAIGRGSLPDATLGHAPTMLQITAHVFFLQDILGFENLSAGLWFICINFQLGLIHAAALCLRGMIVRSSGRPAGRILMDLPIHIGWVLSAASLFYFNRHEEWNSCALYFFPHFFMGIIVHRSLRDNRSRWMFWLFQMLIVAGMCYDWRWRLSSALVVGLMLFVALETGLATRWPRSRVIARLGKISYSLFLVHFPVLVVVSAVWMRLGWNSPWAAMAGLGAAFVASLASAFLFNRYVEVPAAKLSRRWVVADQ